MKEFIEKAFGIKDSELEGWEYNIPEGYTASIENGKIIVKKEESEDEKIRKEILDYIDKSTGCKRWVVWLEKQVRYKFEHGDDNATKVYKNEDGTCFNVSQLERVAKKATETEETAKEFLKSAEIMDENGKLADEYRLEKQGEKKEINLVEILKHYPRGTELYSPLYGKLWLAEVDEEDEIITCYTHQSEQENLVSFYSNGTTGLPDFTISKDCMLFLYDIEKQDESKPADKVEPRFKVGDWVVQGCNLLKIRCVGDKYYCYETVGGYVDDMLVSEIDSLYHLWTIQDAKDGDVLCDGIDTVIYKKNIYDMVRRSMFVHCGINNRTGYWFEVGGISPIDYLPATKEQRDILFQKMHEAGYEWDAAKKELKKIHVIDEGKAEMDYCFTKMMNGEKVSSAWSKDDEDYLLDVNFAINDCFDEGYAEELRNWLKSLKDRIQPQPKYEWKQENTDALTDFENVMMHIGISFFGQHAGLDPNDTNAIKEQANILLELVPKQEWSEEDDKMIDDAIGAINAADYYTYDDKKEIEDWLKSLKERVQPNWKPSDEQLDALHDAAVYVDTIAKENEKEEE